MLTLNNVSTGSYEQSALVANMIMPDRAQEVIDISGNYGVLEILSKYMSGPSTKSVQVTGADGVFSKNIIGDAVIAATIATRTVLTTNTLRLTWTDPNYKNFINNATIGDGTTGGMNLGVVYNHGPGFVDIHTAGNTTAFAATQFAVGAYCIDMFPAQSIRNSTLPESIYQQPTLITNQTSLSRAAITLNYADMFKEWVKWSDGYWTTSQDKFLAKRFMYAKDMRGIFDQYGTQIVNGERVNFSMGLIDAIKDPQRGGINMVATNLLTVGDYDYFYGSIADRQNQSASKLTTICGRGFLAAVQALPGVFSQMVNTGVLNTLGGREVKGFDVYEVTYNGITNKLIHCANFNDQWRFPQPTILSSTFRRRQFDAIVVDLNSYPLADGGVAPAIERRHFGNTELAYDILPGVAMNGQTMMSTAGASGGGSNMQAVSGTDKITFSLYQPGCYDFIATNMGYYSLAY